MTDWNPLDGTFEDKGVIYQYKPAEGGNPMKTLTTTKLPKGSLVLVNVYGLPDDKVKAFIYRASDDLHVGQQVQVPAPDFSIRARGHETLPGHVLGPADPQPPLPADTIRDTLPLDGPETLSDGLKVNGAREMAAAWRKQAGFLLQASGLIYEAADLIEKAIG